MTGNKRVSKYAAPLTAAALAAAFAVPATVHAAMFSERVPTDDAYVDSFANTQTHGSGKTLNATTAVSGDGIDQRTLFQFDLDTNQSIQSVSQAELQVDVHNNGEGETVTIRRLTETFDEGNVTYDDAPTFDDDAGDVVTATLPANGFAPTATIDVSSLLEDNGDLGTFGLRITSTNSTNSTNQKVFYSKENALGGQEQDFGNPPRLTAEYQVIPEPASLALIGLSGVMMLGRRRRRA